MVAALLVEVPEFSGPLDLLLSLFRKRRLDVTAVSLAAVADQYLEQALAIHGDLDTLSEFLLLASQLLVIKSRALLPATEPPGPEQEGAEELRLRLAEYQVLQVAAAWVATREAEGPRSWPRGGEIAVPVGEPRLAPIAPDVLPRLFAAYAVASQSEEAVEALAAASRPSLRERAMVLLESVPVDCWRPLAQLLGDELPAVVATFLAVLALVRRGSLDVRQMSVYGPIELRRTLSGPDSLSEVDLLAE